METMSLVITGLFREGEIWNIYLISIPVISSDVSLHHSTSPFFKANDSLEIVTTTANHTTVSETQLYII